jgi:hypothetical protein
LMYSIHTTSQRLGAVAVETVYRHFGMELSAQARAAMETWIAM